MTPFFFSYEILLAFISFLTFHKQKGIMVVLAGFSGDLCDLQRVWGEALLTLPGLFLVVSIKNAEVAAQTGFVWTLWFTRLSSSLVPLPDPS